MRENPAVEWPTLAVMAGTYAVWATGTTWAWQAIPPLGFLVTTLAITQFSSLQHEVLHGHPFRARWLSEAMVFPGLTIYVPYQRFRDTHLDHHRDERLTDPYDDPEANYLDPEMWNRLSRPMRVILRANNTLLGRILLGPAISTISFGKSDLAAIRAGDGKVLWAWLWHIPGMALVGLWLWAMGGMGWGAYLAAAYLAYGLLKIRTFLEHRAHEKVRGRSVVVEDRGIFALLFLNNNYHSVHHAKPGLAWYKLPAAYSESRDDWLRRNDGYHFRNYAEIFRRYFFFAKDPVPHPLWPDRMERPSEDVAAPIEVPAPAPIASLPALPKAGPAAPALSAEGV